MKAYAWLAKHNVLPKTYEEEILRKNLQWKNFLVQLVS